MATQELLKGLESGWEEATVGHKFIKACVDGSIKPEQFNTWLTQDYLYVRGFVTFAGGVLASAPDKHIEVLLNGIGALTDELNWFRAKAAKRGLKTENTGMQPACQAYRAAMAKLHSAPYAIQATAFWAIEACYNQAWAKVLNDGTAEQYKEFAHRWGNPEFGKYVAQLQQQADEALAQSPDQMDAARAVVRQVVQLELDFWSMAYAGDTPSA